MKPLLSCKSANIVVPMWIGTVGWFASSGPSLGVPMSLAVFIVGVIVVPALTIGLSRPAEVPAVILLAN